MKKITVCILALALTLSLCIELNYQAAIQAAKNSEGTDTDIEQAMYQHGFNVDPFEKITYSMKVKAFFIGN